MTSCSNDGTVDTALAQPISVDKAVQLHGNAGVEFVDPRPIDAIASTTGKIPGARLISIDEIEANQLPAVFADKTIHIVTTCQAGPMAARAAEAFAKLGYGRISWIEGGTQAWRAAGQETIV